MMALIQKLDKRKTRENARELLSDYEFMKRITSSPYSDSHYDLTQAIQYSDMPRNSSNRNSLEDKMIRRTRSINKAFIERREDYRYKVFAIDLAISKLPLISQEILKLSYCMRDKYTINHIAARVKSYRVNEFGESEEIQYSVKNIERLKATALIEFAEAYDHGILLAYEN